MDKDTTCGHSGCGCPKAVGSDYCSPHCEDVAGQDIDEISCDCGHGGCS